MAAPLPDPSPPPRRGAAVPGVAIGVAGLLALVAGLWLALREPEPPAPRVAAVAPQAALPAAPAAPALVAPTPAPAAPRAAATTRRSS
jgi:septal ring-binding cell division protein DamX